MRIVVSGSRDWDDRKTLNGELKKLKPTTIVHGGAAGADSHAAHWAHNRHIPVEEFPALWGKHGRAAGPLRNKEMVDSKPDYYVAFMKPGSKGTADFVQAAERAHMRGHVVWKHPDGTVEHIDGLEALFRTGKRKRPRMS